MTPAKLHHPIRRFMVGSPHSIGREQPLSVAHEQMRSHGLRHLPVLHAGRLVGLLSQRDLWFIETLKGVDPATVPVEDAMSADVFTVGKDTPLAEVATEMANHKYGCAVVVEGSHVVGIFTTVDALRALVEVLGETGDEAAHDTHPPARRA
jgi:acetoin utilization protein AcuB